jgi:hypothetical protein
MAWVRGFFPFLVSLLTPCTTLGEFDQKGGVRTNWGTKEELIAAIKAAKDNGIVSYADVVLNHRFGADRIETFAAVEVDNDDRTKEISDSRSELLISFVTASDPKLGLDWLRLPRAW